MTEADLLNALAIRITALKEQGHSGAVVIEIVMHQGGVRGCEIQVKERLCLAPQRTAGPSRKKLRTG